MSRIDEIRARANLAKCQYSEVRKHDDLWQLVDEDIPFLLDEISRLIEQVEAYQSQYDPMLNRIIELNERLDAKKKWINEIERQLIRKEEKLDAVNAELAGYREADRQLLVGNTAYFIYENEIIQVEITGIIKSRDIIYYQMIGEKLEPYSCHSCAVGITLFDYREEAEAALQRDNTELEGNKI